MSKCIEILNVSLKKNKYEVILDNISMSLNFGEVLTIIGPNGGGKTSLLRVLLGLEKKYFGQVNVNTKNIGYMPQKNFISNNFPIKVRKFLSLFEKKNLSDCDSKWIRLFEAIESRVIENASLENKSVVDANLEDTGIANETVCENKHYHKYTFKCFGNSENAKCSKTVRCLKDFERVEKLENCEKFNSKISEDSEFISDFETLNDIYTSFFCKNEIYNKKNVEHKRNSENKNSSDVIDLVMKFVKIYDLQNKCLTQLSLGELQKVLFASAIINSPSLLVLDEPTNGLDLNSQSHFFNMINVINKLLSTTIIIVSHDLHNVLANSTKVVCMNKHIQCFGSPADICKFCDGMAHYHHSHRNH